MITLWSKITITWNEFIAEFWHLCFTDGLPQLIFTNGGDVMMADIHGRFVRTLVPAQGKGYAIGVATHWNSGKVFWSDIDTNKVSLDHCLGTFLISLLCECQPLPLQFSSNNFCPGAAAVYMLFQGRSRSWVHPKPFHSFARYILPTSTGVTSRRFWRLQSSMSRISLWTGSTSNSMS